MPVRGADRRRGGRGRAPPPRRGSRPRCGQAVEELGEWAGERFGHRPLLARAWELRDTVRGSDAMYVALAEALDAPLVTLDERLAGAPGPTCRIEVVGKGRAGGARPVVMHVMR